MGIDQPRLLSATVWLFRLPGSVSSPAARGAIVSARMSCPQCCAPMARLGADVEKGFASPCNQRAYASRRSRPRLEPDHVDALEPAASAPKLKTADRFSRFARSHAESRACLSKGASHGLVRHDRSSGRNGCAYPHHVSAPSRLDRLQCLAEGRPSSRPRQRTIHPSTLRLRPCSTSSAISSWRAVSASRRRR
jgi:hypothetical protein